MTDALQTMIHETATAMAEQRWESVLTHVAEDVVAHVPGSEPITGVHGLAAFLLETAATADDGEHFEVLDTLVGEHHAAIYFRITATRSDREPLDNHTVHLARIENEKIVEIFLHNFDSEAVAKFWA